MNIQTKMPTTADEFLRWNEGREGKREFVRGRVVDMMVNVTRNHWRVMTRLTQHLISALGFQAYDIGPADFGVRTPDGVRFPDVIVEGAGRDGAELATGTPVLVAEVLSPSSVADDFGPKARDYLSIASLRHYLVLAQDEPRAWLWSRGADDAWIGPEMVSGTEAILELRELELIVPLGKLYEGVDVLRR